MLQIIITVLDMIFPPRETELLVRGLVSKDIERLYCSGVTADRHFLAAYKEPHIHALITENKYHHNHQAAVLLGELLKRYVKESTQEILFIPIPLHRTRLRERGYNQVSEILKSASLPRLEGVLIRQKATQTQTSLSKSGRHKNLKGAFLTNPEKVSTYKHTHFILLDDVITTGATMDAAQASLVPHLHPTSTLTCLSLAH